jgi:hypothetical protein
MINPVANIGCSGIMEIGESMAFHYDEVVKVIETGPYVVVSPDGAPPLHFRVEILRRDSSTSYFARIYRLEQFRVEPTFYTSTLISAAENMADHSIYVIDDFIGSQDFDGYSLENVLEKVKAAFVDMFNV